MQLKRVLPPFIDLAMDDETQFSGSEDGGVSSKTAAANLSSRGMRFPSSPTAMGWMTPSLINEQKNEIFKITVQCRYALNM